MKAPLSGSRRLHTRSVRSQESGTAPERPGRHRRHPHPERRTEALTGPSARAASARQHLPSVRTAQTGSFRSQRVRVFCTARQPPCAAPLPEGGPTIGCAPSRRRAARGRRGRAGIRRVCVPHLPSSDPLRQEVRVHCLLCLRERLLQRHVAGKHAGHGETASCCGIAGKPSYASLKFCRPRPRRR